LFYATTVTVAGNRKEMRMSRRSPFVLGSLAILMGAVLGSGAMAADDPLQIEANQVRVVTFKRPIKTVYVANPLIADITIIDSNRVFLLGKNIGSTNIIALDERGQEAFNDKITVLPEPGNLVTVQRGVKGQLTLSCMDDRCRSRPTVGDSPEGFDGPLSQMAKSDAAKKSAGAQ
jgi:Flp pilus assembly secretin CpaC